MNPSDGAEHRSEPSSPTRLDVREGARGSPPTDRPWLQVWFRCAGHYQRVFRSPDGRSYLARCPSCSKAIRFRVGAGGTGQRCFEVRC